MIKGVNLSAYGHGFFQQIKGFLDEIEQESLSKSDIQYYIEAAIRQMRYLEKHPNVKKEIQTKLRKKGCKTCKDKKKNNPLVSGNGTQPWHFFEYGLDNFFESSIELFN